MISKSNLSERAQILVDAYIRYNHVTLDHIQQVIDTNMGYDDDWSRDQVASANEALNFLVMYGE